MNGNESTALGAAPLRILQVSDFLVNARGPIASWADIGDSAPVDYLFVCGNLTTDGRPASFDRARALLQDLCNAYLAHANEDNQDRANRLVVVPGEQDVARGWEPFQTFYQDFYRQQFQVDRPGPTEGAAQVGFLRDLVTVALPFWNVLPAARARHQAEFWCQAFRSDTFLTHTAPTDREYTRLIPTFLLSAGSPAFDDRVRELIHAASVPNHLRVDCHLTGSGTVFCSTGHPYTLRHLHIATGPRPGGRPAHWPLRANLIHLARHGQNPPRPILRIDNYERAANQAWTSQSLADGCLDARLVEEKWDSLSTDFSDLPTFLEQLRNNLGTPRRLMRMEILPGTGIDDLLRALPGERLDAGVVFEEIHLRENQTAGEQDQALQQGNSTLEETGLDVPAVDAAFQALTQRALAEPATTQRVIGVVYDRAFPQIQTTTIGTWNRTVWDRACAFVGQDPGRFHLLYVVDASNNRQPSLASDQDMQPLFGRGLTPQSYGALLQCYRRRVPCSRAVVEALAGHYHGISTTLLTRIAEDFVAWPGSRALTTETLDHLVRRAIGSEQVLYLSARFVAGLRVLRDGARVGAFLAELVRRCPYHLPVEFTLRSVLQHQPGSQRLYCRRVLEALSAQEIIEPTQQGQGDDAVYRLRVRLPFLRWPPVYRIFVSYRSRYQGRVDAVIDRVNQILDQRGESAATFRFLRDQETHPGATILATLDVEVNRANNFVVFFERAADLTDSIIMGGESLSWVNRWGSEVTTGRAAGIPVALASCTPPVYLAALPVINCQPPAPAVPLTDEAIAQRIVDRLRPSE